MKLNAIDRLVGFFSAKAGLGRAEARLKLGALESFAGASRSRPSMKSWNTSTKDADGDINPELAVLRSRSRDLERNNPIAHGAMRTKTVYVIGNGLRPEPSIDAEFLGLSSEAAEKLQAQILREFNLAADTTEADAARRKTFYQKQAELYHSARVNGDSFLLLPFIERDGSQTPYSTRFQSVEGDRVSNPNGKPDSETMSGGFELDQYGATLGIHILQGSPSRRWLRSKARWQSVPLVDANGRRNVLIHSNHNMRAGQTRGIPDLAPVIEVIKQAGRYIDAELMASVISSKFTVFIKSARDDGGGSGAYAPGGGMLGSSADDDDDDDTPRDLRLGDGLVYELDEGESIETANPGRPNAAFDPFVTALWRMIGGAIGVPFEVLIKHFTASYSASRAALLQFAHYILVDRANFVVDMCQPYYETIIAEAVARGRLRMPGFFRDPMIRRAYCQALWHGPNLGELDELKAVNAAEKRLKIGISTHEREARHLVGADWNQINNRRVIEERRKFKSGGAADGPPEPIDDDDESPEGLGQRGFSLPGGRE
ncbi:TPA: phage portal protein [Pseudomonas aeruginosa]|uniref:phage portal protein n=1 Tax=Pseudomonas aeruginosa TaxID=287 RepID=UPI00068AA6CD|nr:phage portal protein [Pseudomonas aeruginosa]EIU5460367.1 phage portal protein [Pseudomonas aeruginosa]EIU5543750.1 phage portal protein [Pseudomonas aeruginosa]EKW4494340.1 phage portal protein [Pseudomonas aeruginosa]EKY0078173.1 phage portal protein [Pseudomonas aeruginosa]EKY0500299.1 phage portal protein [Pseudomonas aeruginosa]